MMLDLWYFMDIDDSVDTFMTEKQCRYFDLSIFCGCNDVILLVSLLCLMKMQVSQFYGLTINPEIKS